MTFSRNNVENCIWHKNGPWMELHLKKWNKKTLSHHYRNVKESNLVGLSFRKQSARKATNCQCAHEHSFRSSTYPETRNAGLVQPLNDATIEVKCPAFVDAASNLSQRRQETDLLEEQDVYYRNHVTRKSTGGQVGHRMTYITQWDILWRGLIDTEEPQENTRTCVELKTKEGLEQARESDKRKLHETCVCLEAVPPGQSQALGPHSELRPT